MKTKISVADAVRLNACESGLALAIKLSAILGVPSDSEIEFDVLLNIASKHDTTALYNFMLENKAGLLEYTDEQFECYVFNKQEFHSFGDAEIASNSLRKSRVASHKNLISVVFSESLGEDATWTPVDIDSFIVPNHVIDFHFHVFNPMTGSHEECATVEDAKNKRDEIIHMCLVSESNSLKIFARYVYAEDGITTVLRETTKKT